MPSLSTGYLIPIEGKTTPWPLLGSYHFQDLIHWEKLGKGEVLCAYGPLFPPPPPLSVVSPYQAHLWKVEELD